MSVVKTHFAVYPTETTQSTQVDAELNELPQRAGAQFSTASKCQVPPLTFNSNKLTTRSQDV